MRTRLFPLIAAIILSVSPVVLAGPYEDGIAALNRGDYVTALHFFETLADNNNSNAQKLLSVMYLQGLGVPKDLSESNKWLRRAAANGDAEAMTLMGNRNLLGTGMSQNFAEALRWWKLSAAKQYFPAFWQLGNWYAAEGVSYRENPAPDYLKAYMWYDLYNVFLSNREKYHSVHPNNSEAEYARAVSQADQRRDRARKALTPAQIAEAQDMARRCQLFDFRNCD